MFKKIAKISGYAAVAAVGSLLLAEVSLRYGAGRLIGYPPNFRVHIEPNVMEDRERCYTFRPNPAQEFDYYQGAQLLWRTRTGIDRFARRLDGNSRAPQKFRSAVVFMGGSDVFGAGVPDTETLPSQFARLQPQLRTYNYGHPGSGPNQALAFLQRPTFLQELTERPELFVYLLIPSHIRRVTGSYRQWIDWFRLCREYQFGPDGAIIGEGTYEQLHPWGVWFSRLLFETRIGQRLAWNGDIPLRPTNGQLQEVENVFRAMASTIKQKSPGARFVVLTLARQDPEVDALRKLQARLKAVGIDVVDATAREFPALKPDTHLGGEGYRQVAGLLVDHLNRDR